MTLHRLTPDHVHFVAECFTHKGFLDAEAYAEAQDIINLAVMYKDPVFFIGPSYENPRYFIGAHTTVDGRAFLSVGTNGFMGSTMYQDSVDWLSYMFEIGVRLIEAYVWVADLQKEYFLRAVGFQKAGVVPDKLDIPEIGAVPALSLYIRPQDFATVTRESFRAKLKGYKTHRDNLAKKRATQ